MNLKYFFEIIEYNFKAGFLFSARIIGAFLDPGQTIASSMPCIEMSLESDKSPFGNGIS